MSRRRAAAAVRPKSAFDRRLRELSRMRLEEAGPETVDFVVSVVRSKEEATRDRLKASEMVLARLMPTLQAIDVRALMAAFGADADTSETESKFSADKREAVLRLIEMAQGHGPSPNGGAR
jgi:uncharacterized pyridoxal phosphate-containing UPF0001 family protein